MLAQHIFHEVHGNLSYFLTTLTQQIYDACAYGVRPQGDPLPAGVTWETKQGSCRDFTVLFMEACRAVGLAARFVSGYHEGDPDHPANDLHAWAEVYVPGGGWRGFDPTLGLAVSDRHIPLAAAAHPRQAAPVTGALREGTTARSTLTTHIEIDPHSRLGPRFIPCRTSGITGLLTAIALADDLTRSKFQVLPE
jgi:transglutaminase-like putative cysteine protease